MHTTVIVALLPLLVAAGGNDGQIPKRADALAHLSDAEAFEVLSTLGSDVLVGVKRADQPRGMWAGKRLLSVDDERTAIDAVTLAVGANRVLKRSAHSSLPLMRILLDSPEVLTTLRASPHVEYVESASFRVQYASSGNTSGCEDDPYGSLAGAVSNPPNSEGDTEPWNFQHHVIADASMRGYGGGGATVAVIDTGTFSTQTQLWSSKTKFGGRYDATLGGGPNERIEATVSTIFNTSAGDAVCTHGTRVASTIAAPRDGIDLRGVAWMSNLLQLRAVGNAIVDDNEVTQVLDAITLARQRHVAVIQIAWGYWNPFSWADPHPSISLALEAARSEEIVIVAAAGNPPGCNIDIATDVIWPARNPFVVAVTGVDPNRVPPLHEKACGGPEVDLGVVIGETPASGRTPGALVHFGGTSLASSLVSGVVALIRARYPNESASAVEQRLFAAAGAMDPEYLVGRKALDAYRALGGIFDVIAGVSSSGGSTYELGASFAGGDPGEVVSFAWIDDAGTTLKAGNVIASGNSVRTAIPTVTRTAVAACVRTTLQIVDSAGVRRTASVSNASNPCVFECGSAAEASPHMRPKA